MSSNTGDELQAAVTVRYKIGPDRPAIPDDRHIGNGWEIPTEGYADQPYIVKTADGAWLCVVTTGRGKEGEAGQHIVTLRSTDQGRSWQQPVALEPADGPEASYAVLLVAPGGRVFCFYNHNTDNLRAVKADSPPYQDGWCKRVDSLGHFVYKFSDDHGRTWSAARYEIPMREMDIDRRNPYGGAIRFFWNVGKAFCHNGAAYVPLHKVGGFGHGFFTRSEGVLLRSGELLHLKDPAAATWETLPDGDFGLRTPAGGGRIAEEQSFSVMSDGSFFVVYRSVDGHPVCAYSRDGGHTWSAPAYMCFADGTPMRHPRAANFAWKCRNGKYLYWFHNHGGKGYEDRNPVWLCGGVEVPSPQGPVIAWSSPEIVLYDDDPLVRMSYPDLVEEDGEVFLTETQKDIARVHRIAPELLAGLWQSAPQAMAPADPVLALPRPGQPLPVEVGMPELPAFVTRDRVRFDMGAKQLRTGVTLEVWVTFASLTPGQVLLDGRDAGGRGWALLTAGGGTVELVLNDGSTENRWRSDTGALSTGRPQHIVAVVDGGPHIITFIVNGRLCDGGTDRQFGWGRFSPHLRQMNWSAKLRLAPDLAGQLQIVRIYGRRLRTAEAVAAFPTGAVQEVSA